MYVESCCQVMKKTRVLDGLSLTSYGKFSCMGAALVMEIAISQVLHMLPGLVKTWYC
jgi:hypothetical protein